MIRFTCAIIFFLLLAACQQGGPVDLNALAARAKSGDIAATQKLVDLLAMEKNQVSAKVYPLVLEIGQPIIGPLMAKVQTENREQRERVIAALGTLQARAAVQPISEVLAANGLKRRYIAAWALGEIGDPAGIEPLLVALGDSEELVRQYATRSLIKFHSKAVEPLLEFLPKADELAAAGAIRALGDIGDKRALDELLRQADGVNRKDVYLALGKLRDVRAEIALVNGLANADWQVRMNAAMALGSSGSSKSVTSLQRALEDEVPVVREWSARSLSVITGKTVMYRDATGKLTEPYSVYH